MAESSPFPEITVRRKKFVEPTLQEEFSLVAGTLGATAPNLGSGSQNGGDNGFID